MNERFSCQHSERLVPLSEGSDNRRDYFQLKNISASHGRPALNLRVSKYITNAREHSQTEPLRRPEGLWV